LFPNKENIQTEDIAGWAVEVKAGKEEREMSEEN
jgi:hypothetical protein